MSPAIKKSSRLCGAKLLFQYQLPIELQVRLYATPAPVTPMAKYLKAVDETSKPLNCKQRKKRTRQLLILDLNGTLLSRTNRRTGMYVRPHISSFLDYVFDHFRVMVWSSAQKNSVRNMTRLFRAQDMQRLALIWDRSHFGLSRSDYNNKAETIKDLNKIWDKDEFSRYDVSNTVILDDSPEKCILQPHNAIHLPTFDHNDPAFLKNGDNTLLTVVDYLKVLRHQSNVANFIRQTPFANTPVESDSYLDKSCDYYSFTTPGRPLNCDFTEEQPSRD